MADGKLTKEWVDRIFLRLSDIYGKDWSSKISPLIEDAIKQQWATGLGNLSSTEITIALNACRNLRHERIPTVVTFYHRAKGIAPPAPQTPLEAKDYGRQHLDGIRKKIYYKRAV